MIDSPLTSYANLVGKVILPFWSAEGFAAGPEMFCERLDFAGRPIDDVPHRAMVQARQIFVFSHAALVGVFPAGAEPAMRALDGLLDRFCDGGDLRDGVSFSVSSSGRVISATRDSYTHAFVLFALAAAYRLSGEPRLRRAIDQTVSFVDRRLIDSRHFGLHDRHPDPSGLKSQNPLMHLLEAYLALHEAMPDGPFLDRAGTIVAHFGAKLFQDEPGILLEHYAADWSTLPDEPAGRFFEPGHQFEWVWLLQWYGALSGTDQSPFADRLWQATGHHGMTGDGLCFDEVGLDLRPRKLSHRLWPHAEGAKAGTIRHASGDARAAEVAAAMIGVLTKTFLNRPFPAGWIDRVDPDGRALLDYVPASSLYHLYSAFSELSRHNRDDIAAGGRTRL